MRVRIFSALVCVALFAACSEPPSCVFEGDGRYYCWQDEDPDFCASGGGSYAEQTCAERGYTYECTQEEIGEGAIQNEWTVAEGCDRTIPPGTTSHNGSPNGTTNNATNSGLPQVEFTLGSFVDSRDGQEYPTTTVAGATWFAQNLNYEIEGQFEPLGPGSFLYDDDASAAEVYGRDANRAYTRTLAGPDGDLRVTGQTQDGNYLASVRCVAD